VASRREVAELNSEGIRLPSLPATWVACRIGDVANLQPGYAFKSSWFRPDGVRLLRGVNLEPGATRWEDVVCLDAKRAAEFRDYSLRAGDVVIAMDRPIISSGLKVSTLRDSDLPALLLQRVGRFVPTSTVEIRFLSNFLQSDHFLRHISGQATGTQLPHVSGTDIETSPFPLPPLAEQRRIVAKIESLFARSRRAKEALVAIPLLLDQLRQSILTAAFRGVLTAVWRKEHPKTETIDSAIARAKVAVSGAKGGAATETIIPGQWALSVGKPDLPAPPGWQWTPLHRVAALESGHTPSREHPEYWGGDVPWIGIPDARQNHGTVIHQTATTTNRVGLANSAARLLPAGTVCLSRTASVGYVVVMGRPMATSQDFVNWVCSDALVPEFLMYLFLAEEGSLLSFGKGSTHTTIYFPEVKAFHACLPPVDEQREIVRLLQRRLARVESIRQQLVALRETADGLDPAILAKAFRGGLVPQDPNDEPASALLERLRAGHQMRQAQHAAVGRETARQPDQMEGKGCRSRRSSR
jgi:type I restriction enzyme, S subunit